MRFLFVGAHGDCICEAGHAIEVARQSGVDRFDVSHYGFDPCISLFYKEQRFVRSVHWIQPASQAAYKRLVGLSGRRSNSVTSWLPEMLNGSGVEPSDVIPVQLHDIEEDDRCDRWYDAVLPKEPQSWAEAFLKKVGLDRFYLLNPISLQSTQENDHWPCWKPAVRWLLSCTDESYVVVGQKPVLEDISHPRLINISGYTESMLEVFALADRAAGLITTCNGLSYWSILNGVPAVVTSHKHHARSKYFWNWLAYPPNRMVEYDQGVDVFSTLVRSMQDGSKSETRKRSEVQSAQGKVSASRS